jgi:hypothetical protein
MPSDTFRTLVRCVVHWVRRDISRDERAACARRIQSWLNTNHCGHLPESQPLRNTSPSAAHPRQETASYRQQSHWSEQSPNEAVDWDIICQAYSFTLASVAGRVTELPGYQGHGTFYAQARQRLSPSERPAYLQALLELPDTRLYSDEYLNEWETCLHVGSMSFRCNAGRRQNVPELVRRHLPGLLSYPYDVDEHTTPVWRACLSSSRNAGSICWPRPWQIGWSGWGHGSFIP